MIPLVVLDLDGTLVAQETSLPKPITEAIHEAQQAGIAFALCTGRAGFGYAARIAEEIGPHQPHAFQYGAHITYLGGENLQVTALKDETVKQLVRLSRDLGVVLELYTPTEIFIERVTSDAKQHADLIGVTPVVRDLDEVRELEPVIRGQIIAPLTQWSEIEPHIPADVTVGRAGSPTMLETDFISLLPPNIDKGHAIQKLASHLRVDLQNVMAVGDSFGDAPMLEVVGHPRVMGDAPAELQEMYPGKVLPPLAEFGVVQAIQDAMEILTVHE